MPTSPDTDHLSECGTCWAVVEDGMLNAHLEWHERLDAILANLATMAAQTDARA